MTKLDLKKSNLWTFDLELYESEEITLEIKKLG